MSEIVPETVSGWPGVLIGLLGVVWHGYVIQLFCGIISRKVARNAAVIMRYLGAFTAAVFAIHAFGWGRGAAELAAAAWAAMLISGILAYGLFANAIGYVVAISLFDRLGSKAYTLGWIAAGLLCIVTLMEFRASGSAKIASVLLTVLFVPGALIGTIGPREAK